jgi:hypothetical protein
MIEFTDEILNRYIDGELSPDEIAEVKRILGSSEDARKRLNAMKLVHEHLKNYPEKETPPGFSSILMRKIIRRPEPKGQKYFIISVSSFFVLISLSIIGYLASYILSTGERSAENNNTFENLKYLMEKLVLGIKSLFTAGNVSLIGFIFSFAIIISAYFFFDSHNKAKAKLTKL